MPASSRPETSSRAPAESQPEEFEDLLSSQRKALEEMSQHLLDKLDVMVVEQETRAKEFAQRVQSVSSLPQQGDWGASVKPSLEQKVPERPPQRNVDRETPPRMSHGPQNSSKAFGTRERFSSLSEKTMKWMTEDAADLSEKANNKGCIFLVVVLVIIYTIMKFL